MQSLTANYQTAHTYVIMGVTWCGHCRKIKSATSGRNDVFYIDITDPNPTPDHHMNIYFTGHENVSTVPQVFRFDNNQYMYVGSTVPNNNNNNGNPPKYVIFGKSYCPYCMRIKSNYPRVPYVDITHTPLPQSYMGVPLNGASSTVPKVYQLRNGVYYLLDGGSTALDGRSDV